MTAGRSASFSGLQALREPMWEAQRRQETWRCEPCWNDDHDGCLGRYPCQCECQEDSDAT